GLNTREPGLYVVRAQAKDGAGRVSRAAEYVYVWGEGTTGWGEQDERIIALHAERPQYKLGETAKILVPSPFARAEALVTVEREGVLSSERVQLGSAGTIDVAIDQRFVPNAFVSVLLLAPLGEVREGPAFRVGTVELTADVSDRKLSVEVKPEAVEKRPGEELSVALAVKDAAGQPVQAELTVFAVDEGVLALTGYRTPDPFAAIYAPHGLSVWTSDVRSALQRVLDAADEDKGGDEGGGGGAELMRSNFSAVAVYVPSLETDAQGHASLRFKLPDSTTRFRVMAVAASRASSLGAGEATVRTKKPLMMRPLLPRLLRAGDALQAGVVVHNERDADVVAEVTLATEGLSLAQPAQQRVTVPAHGAVQVRYALRAERVGTAKLTFRAAGGAERDALTLTRDVLSPSVMETMSVAGTTSGAVQEALAPLADVRTDVGGLDVSLSASALVELEQPARKLFAYPYGCSEQLSSRLIALASLERMRKPLALGESFAEAAAPVLSELEKHQNADGSFGLWRADDGAVPWLQRFLTAYALIAFDRLQHAGIAISPHAKERARAFLTRTLRDEAQLDERAFVVYALARTGSVELGYANKLFEQRAQLSLLSRIELAHALTKLNEKQAAQAMLDELGSEVRVASDRAHVESNQWNGALESDVRASGALLQMLLEHAPDHVLVPKLARWLSAARGRDGAYVNTQQTAWAVMSLADYLVAREAVPPALNASVRIGARKLGPFPLAGHRASAHASLAMQDLPRAGAPLVLAREGRGTLYYGLQLNYAPSELPKQPIERGFFVERSYERIAPAALSR
ncbi:MAG TPA: alpha-2-macroglobulin family protein, partial [Polyangiales bacterium]